MNLVKRLWKFVALLVVVAVVGWGGFDQPAQAAVSNPMHLMIMVWDHQSNGEVWLLGSNNPGTIKKLSAKQMAKGVIFAADNGDLLAVRGDLGAGIRNPTNQWFVIFNIDLTNPGMLVWRVLDIRFRIRDPHSGGAIVCEYPDVDHPDRTLIDCVNQWDEQPHN